MNIPIKRWSAGALMIAVLAGTVRAGADAEVGVNGFACSLYGKLAKDNENLFFSPFSLGSALAMTAEGARGETARQMGEVLGLDASM